MLCGNSVLDFIIEDYRDRPIGSMTLGYSYYSGKLGLEKNPWAAIYYFERFLKFNPEELFSIEYVSKKEFIMVHIWLSECYASIKHFKTAMYVLIYSERILKSYLNHIERARMKSIFQIDEKISNLEKIIANSRKLHPELLATPNFHS